MKPQDLVFIAVLVLLLVRKKPQEYVYAGLLSIVLAIPLFAIWVFFTAQRLVMYAAVFFMIHILISLTRPNSVQ